MKYDITKQTAPKMPRLGKGTECIKILLSQVSKSMHEPLVPMLFPILGAHVSGSEFQYPDLTWKELCGQMANLVAESGGNKGQLSLFVEVIIRVFRVYDDGIRETCRLKSIRCSACWSYRLMGSIVYNGKKKEDGVKHRLLHLLYLVVRFALHLVSRRDDCLFLCARHPYERYL